MNALQIELKQVRAELSAIHHACWYDAGGVQGIYICPDCDEEKRLRKQEKELLEKLCNCPDALS